MPKRKKLLLVNKSKRWTLSFHCTFKNSSITANLWRTAICAPKYISHIFMTYWKHIYMAKQSHATHIGIEENGSVIFRLIIHNNRAQTRSDPKNHPFYALATFRILKIAHVCVYRACCKHFFHFSSNFFRLLSKNVRPTWQQRIIMGLNLGQLNQVAQRIGFVLVQSITKQQQIVIIIIITIINLANGR